MVQGSLLALDVNAARLGLLRTAARQQGLQGLVTTQCTSLQDFVQGAGSTPRYDGVLLDAPCSGTGVLNKRPDLRWRRTPAALHELVLLQVQWWSDIWTPGACLHGS